jgi:hypothetical protein
MSNARQPVYVFPGTWRGDLPIEQVDDPEPDNWYALEDWRKAHKLCRYCGDPLPVSSYPNRTLCSDCGASGGTHYRDDTGKFKTMSGFETIDKRISAKQWRDEVDIDAIRSGITERKAEWVIKRDQLRREWERYKQEIEEQAQARSTVRRIETPQKHYVPVPKKLEFFYGNHVYFACVPGVAFKIGRSTTIEERMKSIKAAWVLTFKLDNTNHDAFEEHLAMESLILAQCAVERLRRRAGSGEGYLGDECIKVGCEKRAMEIYRDIARSFKGEWNYCDSPIYRDSINDSEMALIRELQLIFDPPPAPVEHPYHPPQHPKKNRRLKRGRKR